MPPHVKAFTVEVVGTLEDMELPPQQVALLVLARMAQQKLSPQHRDERFASTNNEHMRSSTIARINCDIDAMISEASLAARTAITAAIQQIKKVLQTMLFGLKLEPKWLRNPPA